MTDTQRISIVFITSSGHSGSTLLDLLLSSHSQVVSVGEARFGSDHRTNKCGCGAKTVWECAFWQRVDGRLRDRAGITLRELDVWSNDPQKFLRHNQAFYAAVSEASGKRVIVDSSKNPRRLGKLLAAGAFDVRPIHLVRQPHGVVSSYLRKRDGSWLSQSVLYTKRVMRTRKLLRGCEHRGVRYEALVADPEATVRALSAWIGLEFEPGQLEWAGRERHNSGGNRMRSAADSTIRADDAWKTRLSPWQRAGISLLTLPARRP